ncbi:MAG TPA: guanylate kinase [Verrucomicrobiales bacterium]|nr:guanylate kinase [Verrucomicrobiales bacterium]
MSEPSLTTPLLIVISAPSGGGKTTLCDQLLAKHENITRAVTCTTRKPRAGEVDGVHYHFLSREDFEDRIATGQFLEHALVYDNRYGVLESEVVKMMTTGKHVLLNIDVQGAATVRKEVASRAALKDRFVSVFLTPASIDALQKRLLKRGSESEATLQRRLDEARVELEQWSAFDYLIISTTVAEDLRRMEVILEAELMRQERAEAPLF